MRFKKILFLVVLLSLWYYLMSPYFPNTKVFHANASKMEVDNKSLFEPKSGRGVLPVEAQIALYAIDSLRLKDYKLYKSLGDFKHQNDKLAEIYQRINEGAWPIQQDTNSRNLIGFSDELNACLGINIRLQYNNISIGTY